MAWVRWRGSDKAQVLASVWRDGRSKQVYICSFDRSVRPLQITDSLIATVANDIPGVEIDWQEIQRQLDAGPILKSDIQNLALRLLSLATSGDFTETQAHTLEAAANILASG